jgi:hypothetical protein
MRGKGVPSKSRRRGLDPAACARDVDALVGWVEFLSSDDQPAEETFLSKREAFSTGWYLGRLAGAD